MKNISLNIAKAVDPAAKETLKLVAQVADGLDIQFVVIGATARDLVLHCCYGAEIQRATRDIDFAVQVESWAAFEKLTSALAQHGYRKVKVQHRLKSPTGGTIDIVPFGSLQSGEAKIVWPPPDGNEMVVLGMQEALATAVMVDLGSQESLHIPVATPVTLVILKLVSWTERSVQDRIKDARDFLFLLSSYDKVPLAQEEFFSDEELIERSGGDLTLGAAEILGRHAGHAVAPETSTYLSKLFASGIRRCSIETLVEDSCSNLELQLDRHSMLLDAFITGFRGRQ
ncbi:MAG: nucleotidyl transferase AbiEii/AbiGii toxin family protein [Thiotrichales bacterium]